VFIFLFVQWMVFFIVFHSVVVVERSLTQ
jgi:hypothetical protein